MMKSTSEDDGQGKLAALTRCKDDLRLGSPTTYM